MKTKDIILEAISLPVEERTIVADSILKSLNPPETAIDKKWAQTAKKRLMELRTGKKKLFLVMQCLIQSGTATHNEILISSGC